MSNLKSVQAPIPRSKEEGVRTVLWVLVGIGVLAILAFVLRGLLAQRAEAGYHDTLDDSLQLSSPAFENNDRIPADLSCEGAGGSPPLTWSNVPEGTRSFVLVVTDVDIPSPRLHLMEFVHWVLYDLPGGARALDARITLDELARLEAVLGQNGYGQREYVSPCPVSGTHHYVYRLYALDVEDLQPRRDSKGGVLKALEGHVLSYGELVGAYQCTTVKGLKALRRAMSSRPK
jgi:Raf kinase inhibitor-like YbhB/YbcL family protein